jgi:inhibitor of cysteine peptidase
VEETMQKLFSLLFVAALALTACGGKPTEMSEPHLEISDPGKSIEVAAGSEFKIIIESNPSTGYQWKMMNELDESILQFVSMDYRADEPVMPGSGGADVWIFKAIAAGETKIVLGHYPPGQGEPAAQEITFTVIVK